MAASGERTTAVHLLVPRRRADLGKEAFHRRPVSGEQLAVEVAWVPVDEDATDVEEPSRQGAGFASSSP
jgi:hypothetical protein